MPNPGTPVPNCDKGADSDNQKYRHPDEQPIKNNFALLLRGDSCFGIRVDERVVEPQHRCLDGQQLFLPHQHLVRQEV